MLPFGVTIPAIVPQRSEIPEGLTNYLVYIYIYIYIYVNYVCVFHRRKATQGFVFGENWRFVTRDRSGIPSVPEDCASTLHCLLFVQQIEVPPIANLLTATWAEFVLFDCHSHYLCSVNLSSCLYQ